MVEVLPTRRFRPWRPSLRDSLRFRQRLQRHRSLASVAANVVLRERLGKATLREGDVLLRKGPQDATEACRAPMDLIVLEQNSRHDSAHREAAKGWRFLMRWLVTSPSFQVLLWWRRCLLAPWAMVATAACAPVKCLRSIPA